MGAIHRVSSQDELQAALGRAGPGDEITIADGRHADWQVRVACEGSSEQPVVIRSETEGGTVFTGQSSFAVTGRNVVLQALRFEHCQLTSSCVALSGARDCRVTACRFEDASGKAPVVAIADCARDNRVDHCTFLRPAARSIQVVIRSEEPPVGNRIDHNLFQDVPPIGGNGRETIQVGQSQPRWGMTQPRTIVEHNTFLRCDGEAEVISNKSSRNTYRHNLFRECEGELVMRGGSNCVLERNRFERCSGGIRLSGTHHRVMDNVIAGNRSTGIRLLYGMTRELGGHYQAPTGCLIANNTIVDAGKAGIHIGAGGGKDWGEKGVANVAPYDNRFVNNIIAGSTGMLLLIDDCPGNIIEANLFHAKGEATAPEPGVDDLMQDPMFLCADTGDFRLRPDSPAIGAGRPLDDGGKQADIGASAGPVETGR